MSNGKKLGVKSKVKSNGQYPATWSKQKRLGY